MHKVMGNPQPLSPQTQTDLKYSTFPCSLPTDRTLPCSSSSAGASAGPSPNPHHCFAMPTPDEPLPSYEDSNSTTHPPPAHSPAPAAEAPRPSDTPSNIPPVDPPPFSIYQPKMHEHYLNSHVITHDSHLNSDGEALYRFLLEQNKLPPVLHAQITGSHVVSTTVRRRDHMGRSQTHTEQRTVTDFRFRIDLTGGLWAVFRAGEDAEEVGARVGGEWIGQRWMRNDVKGVLKACGDMEKVYRGGRWKQKYHPPRCTSDMQGVLSSSVPERSRNHDLESCGSPHHNPPLSLAASRIEILASTPDSALSIRAWADRYCHLPTSLKEFIVRKTVTNLDHPLLTRLLTNTVRSTGYRGDVAVCYPKTYHKIAIYPDSRCFLCTCFI